MKYGFVIVILVIVAYTALIYFDAAAEQQVYAFCQSHSSGNTIDELRARADEQNLMFTQIDIQTAELTVDNPLSLLNQYVCEVRLDKERIVAQALLKRSLLF